jgi:hypothetical protein
MMTVDPAVLWSRLVGENSVVDHVVGVDTVALWKGYAQGRQQRINCNINNVIAEPTAIWPLPRIHALRAVAEGTQDGRLFLHAGALVRALCRARAPWASKASKS